MLEQDQRRATNPAKGLELTPSAFQKEMSLTIKQRLASTQEMNLPQVVQLQDKSETFITSSQQFTQITAHFSLSHQRWCFRITPLARSVKCQWF